MPWHRSGTATVTINSTTVVFSSNAGIAAAARTGDEFVGPDGRSYEIGNIASDTVLSLVTAYLGPSVANGSYAIKPLATYPRALTDAVASINNTWGQKLAALRTTGNYDTLPLSKGGTERSDGRAIFSEVVVNQPSALGAQQGLSQSWNELGTGEGNFTVNRGGGVGGFTWRSVNQTNTQGGPRMTYSYDGDLAIPGKVSASEISSLTTALAVALGGTGGKTPATARAGLQLGSAAVAAIIGAVSQSGGTPTGAIMELGNTATGSYVRFANGLQVCWTRAYTFGPTTANATVSANWSPPIAFFANVSAVFPMLQFPQSNDAALINRLSGFQVGSGQITIQGNFNMSQAYTLAIFAIGTWF